MVLASQKRTCSCKKKNYAAGENSKSFIYFLSLEDDLGNLGLLCPQVRFHVHGAVQFAETFCSASR